MARHLLSIPSAGAISILQVGCLMRPAFVATLQPAARRGTLLLLIQNTAGHSRFSTRQAGNCSSRFNRHAKMSAATARANPQS